MRKVNFHHFKKRRLALAVLSTLSVVTPPLFAYTFIDAPYLASDGVGDTMTTGFYRGQHTFDGIQLTDFHPISKANQFTINVKDASLTINGSTWIDAITLESTDQYNAGTYTIHAGDHWRGSGDIHLKGDVSIFVEHAPGVKAPLGANVLYAQQPGSVITVGTPTSHTRLWAIAQKPDLISAKVGGQVIIESIDNQLIGSFDMMSANDPFNRDSRIAATLSGPTSFWFGDDQTVDNFIIHIRRPKGRLGAAAVNDQVQVAQADPLDLTIEKGAQWTYFGESQTKVKKVGRLGVEVSTIPKRLSAVTLQKGGIINLYDEDIRTHWQTLSHDGHSLVELWPELADVKHDYVRLGNLKGTGGIFRLDLNADELTQSDMIYIERSTTGGQFFIEPYRPQNLKSIGNGKTLTVALTKEAANNVSFVDKENIYGETLFDYELGFNGEPINDTNKASIATFVATHYPDFTDFSVDEYQGGTRWFIDRFKMTESAATHGIRSAGSATYDAAIDMTRRDERQNDAVFAQGDEGLWVRVEYASGGIEASHKTDMSTVHVGMVKALNPTHRVGGSLSVAEGKSDFLDVHGSADMDRYTLAVTDTLLFGPQYLDLVGRVGQVKTTFEATNGVPGFETRGQMKTHVASVSAEYGVHLEDQHHVYIEPQCQLQVAYLKGFDSDVSRGMHVEADHAWDVTGRVGLRTGRTFRASDHHGEVYLHGDVLHTCTEGQEATLSDPNESIQVTWGNKDTWATLGLGGYWQVKDALSIELDLEKTLGGQVMDDWSVAGRVYVNF